MLKIIKGALGLVIPEEWGVLLKETHINMCFLSKFTNKTMNKIFLPLQTLEFKRSWLGGGRASIAAVFNGSIRIPSLETTKPKRRPISMQKTHLCGLNDRIL